MKNIKRWVLSLILLAFVILPTSVSASGLSDDKVIFGGSFTLRAGETLNGDLIVFGGNLVLEKSSTVNGDCVIFGGNVTANGTFDGNLIAMGGIVELQNQTQITGDLTVLGGSYEQADGVTVSGNIITEENIPFTFSLPENLSVFKGNYPAFGFHRLPFVSVSWFFFRLLIWTGLAILISLFIHEQAAIINQAALGQPLLSFLVGLGIFLVAPLVLIALIITILLSPVSLLGVFALIVAWVVGLVSISIEVGRKLASALDQSWSTPILAGTGMFILSLILNGFNQIVPCFGLMPKFVLGLWVIGAVALTRFGTQRYPAEESIEPDIPPPDTEQLPEDVTSNDKKGEEEPKA